MKNILFFIESLSGGGAEKVLVTLLKHIDHTKFHIILLTLVDTGILKNEIDTSKIDYRTVIKQSSNPIHQLWNKIKYKLIYQYLPAKIVYRWIIPQKRIDTYISFTEGYCTKILSHSPTYKIAWVHIDLKALPWTINEKIYSNIEEEKTVYLKYNKVICVSNSVKIIMQQEYGLENAITIYNPIDTERILKLSNESSNYTISKGFNIISVGRLTYQKGYDILIPIISHLIKKGMDIHLYLLGEGNEKKNLKHIIEKENIENNIHLMGYFSNPYSFMKKMDLFVCSSRSEGYSLVIAEALTLGLPVISMNCSGPNELLANNKYGKLCNNFDNLEKEIIKAYSNKEYLEELKSNAKKGNERFNISNIILNIENILIN